MGREQRDFQQRAARGDPRALRDIASGRVPLPARLRPTPPTPPKRRDSKSKKTPDPRKVDAGKKGFKPRTPEQEARRTRIAQVGIDKLQKKVSQKGKFDPGKPPAKSVAQSRNANIVNRFFGGTGKIARGGGGGGPAGTPKLSTGVFNPFKKK
jgi:hypothetical protein